ncbi:hypothetical protein PIB30_090983, partial [Stylosanthes scabra]|nr:hypothetical protein [Stylosanthes scabra]
IVVSKESNAEINDTFPDEQLLSMQVAAWFADFANYLVKKIKSLEDVYQKKKLQVFCIIAIIRLLEVTLVPLELRQKSFNVVSIGQHCLKIHTNLLNNVMNVKELEISQEDMKCH